MAICGHGRIAGLSIGTDQLRQHGRTAQDVGFEFTACSK
jgi:hypothetical protein